MRKLVSGIVLVLALTGCGSSSGSGSITFSPATVNCSNPAAETETIQLPASVAASAAFTETFDGKTISTGVVSTGGFQQQSDGTWKDIVQETVATLQAACAVWTDGVHPAQILDASGKVLAQGSVTVSGSANSGGAASANGGGGGGAGDLTTFCADEKSDTQVLAALVAVEDAQNTSNAPSSITAYQLSLAAASATHMAGEAPATGPGIFSQVQVRATMTNAARTLNDAATKMTNGDTSGYTEYLVSGNSQDLSTTYGAQIADMCSGL